MQTALTQRSDQSGFVAVAAGELSARGQHDARMEDIRAG
jgi:hypothetical protein